MPHRVPYAVLRHTLAQALAFEKFFAHPPPFELLARFVVEVKSRQLYNSVPGCPPLKGPTEPAVPCWYLSQLDKVACLRTCQVSFSNEQTAAALLVLARARSPVCARLRLASAGTGTSQVACPSPKRRLSLQGRCTACTRCTGSLVLCTPSVPAGTRLS